MAFKVLFPLALCGILTATIGLAAAAPSRTTISARHATYLRRQAQPGITPRAEADYSLPPPDDVFKYLANPTSYEPPAELLPATGDPAVAEGEAKVPEPHAPTLEPASTGHSTPTTTKLVIVAAVVAGIVGFIICAYFVLDWPMFNCCRRRQDTKEAPENSISKDIEGSDNSLNSSVALSVNGLPLGAAAPNPPGVSVVNGPPLQCTQINRADFHVIDIGPRGPLKPQSFISASEYSSHALGSTRPYSSAVISHGTESARSSSTDPGSLATFSARTSAADLPSGAFAERSSQGTVLSQGAAGPLLTPHEFFSLATSPKQSVKPLFGHHPTRDYASEAEVVDTSKKRAGDHRKSKSVSGLVYMIDTKYLDVEKGPGSAAPSVRR